MAQVRATSPQATLGAKARRTHPVPEVQQCIPPSKSRQSKTAARQDSFCQSTSVRPGRAARRQPSPTGDLRSSPPRHRSPLGSACTDAGSQGFPRAASDTSKAVRSRPFEHTQGWTLLDIALSSSMKASRQRSPARCSHLSSPSKENRGPRKLVLGAPKKSSRSQRGQVCLSASPGPCGAGDIVGRASSEMAVEKAKQEALSRSAACNRRCPMKAVDAELGKVSPESTKPPPDDMGPMTAKETYAVISGTVRPENIRRLRQRPPPPLLDFSDTRMSMLWKRRHEVNSQLEAVSTCSSVPSLCLILGEELCAGIGAEIVLMLGSDEWGAAALTYSCQRLHQLVWRTLEPLCSVLHSRKMRRALRATAAGEVASQRCDAQAIAQAKFTVQLNALCSSPPSKCRQRSSSPLTFTVARPSTASPAQHGRHCSPSPVVLMPSRPTCDDACSNKRGGEFNARAGRELLRIAFGLMQPGEPSREA